MATVNNPFVDGCCGCGACLNICPKDAISLREDAEGFACPSVDTEKCIDCSLCVKTCPVLSPSDERLPLKVYAAKNTDLQERKESSSGGIFLPLAREIIRRGGKVFGVEFSEDFRSARHAFAADDEGVRRFSGSKYMQSDTGRTYSMAKSFLEAGQPVLYSGTPCQIAGLKRFLRKDYEELYTVDLVCHGVPSPKIWRRYLDETAPEGMVSVNFRDKVTGWKRFSLVMKDASGKTLFSEREDANVFMDGFLKNLYLRPSCYRCPARKGRSGSDITIADYWHLKKVLPDFDDNVGVGLVLVNTDKGARLFGSVDFEKMETGYAPASAGNPAMEHDFKPLKGREEFFRKEARAKKIVPLIREYVRDPLSVRLRKRLKKLKKTLSGKNRGTAR